MGSMALVLSLDAAGFVKVNGSAVNGVQFSGFTSMEGNLHGVSRMPGATNETPILSFLQEKVAVNPFTGKE